MNVTRRGLLTAVAGAHVQYSKTERSLAKSSKPLVVNSISTLESPTYSWWAEGGADFARQRDALLTYQVLQHEGNFQKCLSQITLLKHNYPEFCVLNLDLFSGFSARPLIDICEKLKIFLVTHSGRSGLSDVDPWRRSEYYVGHLIHNQREIGTRTAEALMHAIGSRGRIVGLGGPVSDEAAEARREGYDAVGENFPQVERADFRSGEWEASSAYEITRYWLSHFSDRIDGIWAANDRMALGAVEALRRHRLVSKVAIIGIDGFPPALESVRLGEMTATIPRDAFYEGGIGLSLGWKAFLKTIDVNKLPHNRREFSLRPILIDKSNVVKFLSYRQGTDLDVDWDDLWVRSNDILSP